VDERLRQRVDGGRPRPADPLLERVREDVRDCVGDHHLAEDQRPPPQQGQRQRDREEDEPLGAEPREPDEDLVEPVRTVMDDPALDVPVEGDQLGSSSFARWISWPGSNGLPMKP
jgi:hypothetical protein